MATSRPLRQGEWLLSLRGVAIQRIATGQEAREDFVLQEDFGIHRTDNDPFWLLAGERVFAVPGVRVGSDPRLAAAITNGTAPGLYVREGDDTSDWVTYRQVLARRVEEAMARRGGETATAVAETTTRQDEIRVGDVVEVVSNTSAYTMASDVGGGGRITRIENSNNVRTSYVDLEPCQGWRLPVRRCAGLPDVRKVSSSSPITIALNVSPMSEQEAARIATAVTDEVRRSLSSTPMPPVSAPRRWCLLSSLYHFRRSGSGGSQVIRRCTETCLHMRSVWSVSKVDPPKSDGVDFGAINMMYARNRYMVDRCHIVVAAWDGSRGGTGHCVDYARQKGKEIIVLTPGRVCQYGPNDIDIQGDKMYYINPQPVSNTL